MKGLSFVPVFVLFFILVKLLVITGVTDWYVYFPPGVIDATSNYYYMELNDTVGTVTTGSTPPDATTFNSAATGAIIAYCFADISGKENVVAASVLFPTLLGAFGIIRIMTNMQHIIADMDDAMKSTNFGTTVQATPISVLKLVFAAFFIIVGLVQLSAIY